MRSLRLLPVLLLAATLLAAPASPASAAAPYPDWPGWHNGANHAGVSTTMPAAVGRPRLVGSVPLDGPMFASPIVVNGVVIAATENDSVYGLTPGGKVLWRSTFGPPASRSELPCGNIDPSGITGTPVYSAATGLVYFVVEHGGPVSHVFVAIDARSGKLAWSQRLQLPEGTEDIAMQQRGALNISGGRVWVTFGARAGDCGHYKGTIIGLPLQPSGTSVSYTIPTDRQGGMWNPAGPTVDSSGAIYQTVGNGSAFPGDDYDYTNSVLKFDTDARLTDYFAPSNWAENNQIDQGLGSQAPALVGDYIFEGGKSDTVYVLRRNALGGIGGQVSSMELCRSFGGTAVLNRVVFVPCLDGVTAVRVERDGAMTVLWRSPTHARGSPVIGGGRVWTLDRFGGLLYGLNRTTGESLGSVAVGDVSHFATPALYGRYVLVPTLAGLSVVRTS